MRRPSTATVQATCLTVGGWQSELHGAAWATDRCTTPRAQRPSSPTALASRSAALCFHSSLHSRCPAPLSPLPNFPLRFAFVYWHPRRAYLFGSEYWWARRAFLTCSCFMFCYLVYCTNWMFLIYLMLIKKWLLLAVEIMQGLVGNESWISDSDGRDIAMSFNCLPSENVFALCQISKTSRRQTFLFENTNSYLLWRCQIAFLCLWTSVMACYPLCVYMLYIINALLYNQANAIILQKYGLGEVKQCNYIPFDSEDIFFLGHTSLDPAIFHAISLPWLKVLCT